MTSSRLPADILIYGCDVVSMDAAASVVADGAIAVHDGRIAWVGPAREADALVMPRERIDARGQIAAPGTVDAHFHTAQQLMRGLMAAPARAGQLKNPVWRKYFVPFESVLEPADVHLSGMVAYANMISVGTTCFADAGGPFPDEMGRAADHVGIRGFIARSTADSGAGMPSAMLSDTRTALNETVALVRRWRDHPRVKASMSLRQILVCSTDLIQGMTAAAASEESWIHTHLCEGTYEIDYALERFNARPAEYLDRIGVFDRRFHCAHSVLLSANEMDLFAARGPSACHCAFNNYGLGVPRVTEMIRRGVRVGLGTDGVVAGGTLDMFRVAHATRIGQQAVMGTPAYHRGIVTPGECWNWQPWVGRVRWRSMVR